jgi:hypothetical protein
VPVVKARESGGQVVHHTLVLYRMSLPPKSLLKIVTVVGIANLSVHRRSE